MYLWLISGSLGVLLGVLGARMVLKKELDQLTAQLADQRAHRFRRFQMLSPSSRRPELVRLVRELNAQLDADQRQFLEQSLKEQRLREDLANISHDLRTPLTVIHGYLELLTDPALEAAERTHYLAMATERTLLLQDLIQNLFYLTRLESGALPLEKETVDLSQLVTEKLLGHYDEIAAHDLALTPQIADGLLVSSHKIGLNRVIDNLLTNMTEHAPAGACAELSLVREDERRIRLTVANELAPGSQIDEKEVFTRHYMGKTERYYNHSGLGLPICLELCRQLGHELTVRTSDGWFRIDMVWTEERRR